MLNVTGLKSGYGPLPVLHGVDLDIASGEVVGLLGRNGAGKTTLLRALAGALPITAGRVALGGTDVRGLKPISAPAPASPMCRRGEASSAG